MAIQMHGDEQQKKAPKRPVYKKAIEIERLTDDQLRADNEVALRATKRTLAVISASFNIPADQLPKPDWSIMYDFMFTYYEAAQVNPQLDFTKVALMVAFLIHSNYVSDLTLNQALSGFAYLLALNGLVLKSIDGSVEVFVNAADCITASGSRAYQISYGGRKFKEDCMTLISARVAPAETTTLPVELVTHLSEMVSVEDIALEVCRIMMLGPKTKRAEDAVGALVNAWSIMNKNK